MDVGRARGPWAIGGIAAVLTTVLIGIGILRPPGTVDVFLEPAGATGPDAFMVLESPDLRIGDAERLALGGGIDIRVGIEPGLYGGSGSDHFCDPDLIADFLAENPAKASAWAGAAGIEVDGIDEFLDTLTPVRLLADTWVTNHGYRDGKATPRQSVLQAGTMVLVDQWGVPRVRCRCGNPLQPPQIPDDRGGVDFVGEPWEGFDPDQLVAMEPGDQPVEWFTLVQLETGQLVARPVGTSGEEDVPVDEDGAWIPQLDLELPPAASMGDGPFALPPLTSGEIPVEYRAEGPCRVVGDELVLAGDGVCTVTAASAATPPWGALERVFEIEVGRQDQEIRMARVRTIVLGAGPVELGAVADSLLPVTYEVSGPCEIDGTELVPTGVGTCEVTISQPGDERWSPAEPLVVSIEITDDSTLVPVTISLDLPATVRLDGGSLQLAATTSPRRPVTWLVAGACGLVGGDTLVPESVGDCEIVAVAEDDARHQRAVTRTTLTVHPGQQTVDLGGLPASVVLSDTVLPLPATSSAGVPISYDVSGDCRLSGQGVLFSAAGSCVIVASAAGTAETEPATERVEIAIIAAGTVRAGQTITFAQPAGLVVGGAGVRLQASSSSGLTVSLTVTAGDCRLSGSTLSPGGAGRCTVVASQPGDAANEPAEPVTRTVTVAKRTPTLTISVTGGSASEMIEGESRTVTGTVSAGPAASITGTAGPCTRSGSVVTATGTSSGSCVVTVASPGDADHLPVSGTTSIRVKRRQTVSLTVPASSIFVGGRVQPQASSSAGLPVTLSVAPSNVCSLDAGTVVGNGVGRCTITAQVGGNADYVAASRSATVDVTAKRTPVVTITAPATMVVGDTATVAAVSSESGVTVTIGISGSACQDRGRGVVAAVASGTCTITATHPATSQAEAGSARATISVSGRRDGIAFDCIGPCDIPVDETLNVAVVSQSGLPPTASTSGPCHVVRVQTATGEVVVGGDGPGTCTLTATTAGNGTWQAASNSIQIPVTVPTQPASIKFDLGQDMYVGLTRSFTISHNVTSKVTFDVTTSKACTVSVDPAGTAGAVGAVGTVVAVDVGTCSVTITVSGAGYTPAKFTDTLNVVLG